MKPRVGLLRNLTKLINLSLEWSKKKNKEDTNYQYREWERWHHTGSTDVKRISGKVTNNFISVNQQFRGNWDKFLERYNLPKLTPKKNEEPE